MSKNIVIKRIFSNIIEKIEKISIIKGLRFEYFENLENVKVENQEVCFSFSYNISQKYDNLFLPLEDYQNNPYLIEYFKTKNINIFPYKEENEVIAKILGLKKDEKFYYINKKDSIPILEEKTIDEVLKFEIDKNIDVFIFNKEEEPREIYKKELEGMLKKKRIECNNTLKSIEDLNKEIEKIESKMKKIKE